MAALFQGEKKRKFDWTGAILGAFSPEAAQMHHKKRDAREEDEREQSMIASLRNSLAKENLPEHVIDGLMSDPKRVSEIMFEKYKTREGGPGGISVGGIGPDGQLRTQTSAGWQDGSYFGGSNGTQAPRLIHEDVKAVPLPEGGSFIPVGGVTGRDMRGLPIPGGVPTAPQGRLTTEEIEELERSQGGAGQQGPQTFPSFGQRDPSTHLRGGWPYE